MRPTPSTRRPPDRQAVPGCVHTHGAARATQARQRGARAPLAACWPWAGGCQPTRGRMRRREPSERACGATCASIGRVCVLRGGKGERGAQTAMRVRVRGCSLPLAPSLSAGSCAPPPPSPGCHSLARLPLPRQGGECPSPAARPLAGRQPLLSCQQPTPAPPLPRAVVVGSASLARGRLLRCVQGSHPPRARVRPAAAPAPARPRRALQSGSSCCRTVTHAQKRARERWRCPRLPDPAGAQCTRTGYQPRVGALEPPGVPPTRGGGGGKSALLAKASRATGP